ncbi:MAG: endonuclease [Bacteroides sp.]|nr:endonuclease [Bacteroides sp.]MCM1389786.1 endonuclease [Bacteroides sp.]
MKKYFLLISALIFTIMPSHPDIMEYAKGRSGIALKNAFRIHCAPLKYDPDCSSKLPDIYRKKDEIIFDMISGSNISINQSSIIQVVPSKWMEQSLLESSRISIDLHNLAFTESTIFVDRKTYPFATVFKDTEIHGNVYIGYSSFRNDMIQAVEPHNSTKGNIARIIFYAVTMYPVSLWTDWGGFFFDNNPYPTLTNEAADLYMEWHRNDPVDDDELRRCMEIKEMQGNINPFVTNPEIAEYLWGDKKGEIYGIESSRVPEMLKAVYSKRSDPKINLSTPYLPQDTQWWIDRKKVDGDILTSSLSEGKHELRFASTESCGKLIITITK